MSETLAAGLTPEQEMLRATARRFLADKAPLPRVRQLMETESGFDASLWKEIADQGWQAMAIPEEYGGAGFTILEQSILMEEMGRTLFPLPYLSSVVIGADLILTAGTEAQRQTLLPGIAAGDRRVAFAHLEPKGRWDDVSMTAREDGDDLILSGTKSYVIDGHTADTLLVAVRHPGDALSVVIVDADTPGVSTRRLETMDMTRKQAEVVFSDVRVPLAAVLGEPGGARDAIADTLARAGVAIAHEQVGGAEACLQMSVDYAKVRVQFGRPIGSFQAIKHLCADMLVRVEAARSVAYHAARAISLRDDEQDIAAPLAKAYCSEAYFRCAADTIQVHGGIGFTWEHDAHLFFKRAKTDELLFGTPAEQRAILADRLGF